MSGGDVVGRRSNDFGGRHGDDAVGRQGITFVGRGGGSDLVRRVDYVVRHHFGAVGRHGDNAVRGSRGDGVVILLFVYTCVIECCCLIARMCLVAGHESGLRVAFVVVRVGPGVRGRREVKVRQRHLRLRLL